MTTGIEPGDSRYPFLLAADIDGTLLGSTKERSWLCDFLALYPDSVYLAYMTGRSLPSVRSLIAEKVLPPPHFICSHVGTELIDYRNENTEVHERFVAAVDSSAWDLARIYRMGVGEGIRPQVFNGGRPPFQAGFLWDGNADTLAAFKERLVAGISHTVVVSHGRFIDIIPACLGKGNAVCFLREHIPVDGERVVVAGDSGNDRSMFETPFKGIVPANSYDELKAAADKPWHYHSPYTFSTGVLDGLCYFGFVKGK